MRKQVSVLQRRTTVGANVQTDMLRRGVVLSHPAGWSRKKRAGACPMGEVQVAEIAHRGLRVGLRLSARKEVDGILLRLEPAPSPNAFSNQRGHKRHK